METLHREIIPARKGKASRLDSGQLVKVINTHGQQVVDTWAFNAADPTEFMSMEHTRTALARVMVATGDALVTNRRRPILTIVEDTSPGIHDTLLAACDRYRYEQLGCIGFPRQLHRQPGRGPGRVGCYFHPHSQPVEPIYEYSRGVRRPAFFSTSGLRAWRLCSAARRNGLSGCLFRLPPGHGAD